MKKIYVILLAITINLPLFAQNSSAKKLLDEVSLKMGAYTNMKIDFSSKLVNREAGLLNEAPIKGNVILSGEKYNLNYAGNNFIFDGKKLAIVNTEEKEVSITDGNMEEDGFIYPSKLLTFYKKGYRYKMGKLQNNKGRKIQYVELTPIDSNSDISKVKLGIDAKTKHIYNLIQIGTNGTETTITINAFKANLPLSIEVFSFDKSKYEEKGYLID